MKLQKWLRRFTWIAVFFLVTCIGFPLSQFADGDAFNISKIGELAGYGSSYSDVAVLGNHAYCIGDCGLDIVDISAPASPRLTASYSGLYHYDSEAEVEVENNRAYVVGGDDLYIIDVSSPAAPSLLSTIKVSDYGEDALFIEGGYLYIGNGFEQTIKIIDISGPTPPTTVTTTHQTEWSVYNLHVTDGYLYAAAGAGGVQILDVSTPTAPFWVAEIESVGDGVQGIFIAGNDAYVLEKNFGLIIYDISTPQSAVKTGEYEISDYSFYDGVHVADSLAFIWNSYYDIKIIDVSNPSMPVLKNDYKYPGDYPRKVLGEGNLVYIADEERGLQIIDVTNPTDPDLLGSRESYGSGHAIALYGDYLYMGKDYALQILDISNPSSPKSIGAVTTDLRVFAVAIKGAYAFVSVGYYASRLQVYNLSNPESPVLVREISFPGSNGDTYFISIRGNYAYVGSFSYLRTFDISDPVNPVQTDEISASCSYICFNGDYAYLGGYAKTKVLDISSPAVPKVLNTLNIYAFRMVVKGNYAYIVNRKNIFIYNLSDPVSPSLVSSNGQYFYIEHLMIEGNYLYLVDYKAQFVVMDISNPVSPKVMGFYDADVYMAAVTVRNNIIYFQEDVYSCTKDLHVFQFQPVETPPELALDRAGLYFSAVVKGAESPAQSVWVTNQGGGSLWWRTSADSNWIEHIPNSSTTGSRELKVWVGTSPRVPGSYTGTVTVQNEYSPFESHDITVHVQVYEPGTTAAPFGQTATPENGAVVSGSVPFTGWALDDVGVKDVKLYLKTGNTLTPVGDALFVAGARPDIEAGYPTYPQSYKAGWGYMMLTNFLPGGGNGTYAIRAIATDMEGNETILGTTTIHVDNANAVKPFGAVDTPAPGGTASGSDFINHGWVLTPPPNHIPTGGSTITVWVDGQPLGHPVYNQYRSDIADLFPGYNNSNAAGGYYYLDTTKYANGVHTISWTAEDNVGNAEGIGSRYFSIQNSNNRAGAGAAARKHTPGAKTADVDNVNPVQVRKGFGVNAPFETLYPGESGDVLVEIQELERLEILLLPPDERVAGVVAGPLVSLPIGASLDAEQGVFYWIPGPGFVGDYALSFWVKDASGDVKRKKIHIRIHPKQHEAVSAIN